MMRFMTPTKGGNGDSFTYSLETERGARRALDDQIALADDLREFSKLLKSAADGGYAPQIDDGILLNAAPLHPLLPSWPETETAWEELAAGEYDWAHQAMAYWPDRVKAVCRTNRSFAIAHGLMMYNGAVPDKTNKKKGRARKKAK